MLDASQPVEWNTANSFLLSIRQRISVESGIFIWNHFRRIWNVRCLHVSIVGAIPICKSIEHTFSPMDHIPTPTPCSLHTYSQYLYLYFSFPITNRPDAEEICFFLSIEYGISTKAFLLFAVSFYGNFHSHFSTAKQTIERTTKPTLKRHGFMSSMRYIPYIGRGCYCPTVYWDGRSNTLAAHSE